MLELTELTLDRRKVTIKEKELGIMTSICRSKKRIPGRVPLLVGVGLEALGFADLLHLAGLHVVVLLQLLLVSQASCCSHGGGGPGTLQGRGNLIPNRYNHDNITANRHGLLQRAGNLLELLLPQLVIRVILALAPLDLLDKLDFLPPTKKERIKFHLDIDEEINSTIIIIKKKIIYYKIVMKNQVPTKFAIPEKYTASPTDLLSDAVELVPPV